MRTLDPKMLAQLVCPETRQPLTVANDDLLAELTTARTAGSLKNHAGHMVNELFEQVLVRTDGKAAYLVVDGVPSLLSDERIDL